MKLRLSRYTVPTLVLGLSSLLIFMVPSMAQAVAPSYTCTWTGGGSNSNFSTAANWSGCNSAAPVAGASDNLIFVNTALSAAATVNNDITNLGLGSIAFQGTNSNYNFTITGNAISLSGGITVGTADMPTIDVGLTLTASQSISGGGNIFFGDNSNSPTISISTYALTIGSGSDQSSFWNNDGSISGSGSIVIENGATLYLESRTSSSWTGAITAEGSGGITTVAGGIGSASSVTIPSGAYISLCGFNGADFASDLSIGGTDAIKANARCDVGGSTPTYDATASVNFTGTVALTANTTISTVGTVTISGPLSGNFTIGIDNGLVGKLVIDSSNNQSGTGNITVTSAVQVITVAAGDNQSTLTVEVAPNQEYIIDGVRGATTVDSGGLLKGVGTVGDLTVNSGGTVSPGHSPGCLTVSGDLTEGGIYQAALGGTTACTDYNQLDVTGTVTLDDGSTPPVQGILQVSLVDGFTPKTGQTFEIINNEGNQPVSDTFANLPEGSTITVNGYVFKISYKGGDGNDVVLTVASVPAAPNTGFGLTTSNWPLMASLTTLSALTLFVLARRYNRLTNNK